MIEQSLLMEWVYGLLWVFAGAYSASLGTTAGYRITGFRARGRDDEQYHGLIGDSVFHTLGRLMLSLLWRSRCDNCNKMLPVSATHPLWGAWVRCLDRECKFSGYRQSWRERLKYFSSELGGGLVLLVLWWVLGRYMHSMLVMMLLPFLVCFLISIRNRVHQIAELEPNAPQRDGSQSVPVVQDEVQGSSSTRTPAASGGRHTDEPSSRSADDSNGAETTKNVLSQLHAILTIGVGFAIIGWALPIEPNNQYLGMAIWGWAGWSAGIWQMSPQGSGIEISDDEHSFIPVRSFVCGLIAGAWFGAVLGAIVCLPVFIGLALRRRCSEHYVEECMLIAGTLVIVGLVGLPHLEIDSELLNTLGTDFQRAAGVVEAQFDVFLWLKQ